MPLESTTVFQHDNLGKRGANGHKRVFVGVIKEVRLLRVAMIDGFLRAPRFLVKRTCLLGREFSYFIEVNVDGDGGLGGVASNWEAEFGPTRQSVIVKVNKARTGTWRLFENQYLL